MGKDDPAGKFDCRSVRVAHRLDFLGRVRVYVRARPPNSAESVDPEFQNVLEVVPEECRITVKKELETPKVFYFDNVFQPTITQEEVYDAAAKHVVEVRRFIQLFR